MASTRIALAQSYGGALDLASCAHIGGWAWDATQPNTPISVDLYDGSLTGPRVATVYANAYRPDLAAAGLGNGYHAFGYATPPALKDGRTHTVIAAIAGTNI